MVWLATADQRVTAESGITRYLEEIRQVLMLEPHEEHMLAKRWREHGDPEAAHKLVNSHLRLVARIATGLSRLRLADLRIDLGGQYRSDAGGQALRAGQGLPARHLCHMVDQGCDPGIHPALVVPGKDGHHGKPEEAVLQPAQG